MPIIIAALSLLVALPSLYLGVLGLLASLPRLPRALPARKLRRFCVIVPAHNEASRIGALFDSLDRQSYSRDHWQAIVVADNCTDQTAAIARDNGASVIERRDKEHRGKGYALEAGLRHIPEDAEAVLFVDGDCTVSENMLATLNDDLEADSRCIQCRYEMDVDPVAATANARRLALALVHVVRPLAKERLHASAGLKGSGMCFDRTLIDELGWSAHGLAEDVEQHIALLELGERVRYEHHAVVTGDAPSRLGDAASQHERWEAGRMSAAASKGPRLLIAGIRHQSIPMLDAAFELMIPPLSVLGAALTVVSVLAAAGGGTGVRLIALAGWCSLGCYAIAGFVRSGLKFRDAATLLITAPAYAVWKVFLYGRTVLVRPKTWNPTRGGRG